MLNYNEFFDLEAEKPSRLLSNFKVTTRAIHISTARHFKYSYEDDEFPSDEVICELLARQFPALKQLEVGLFEDVNLIFDLPSGSFGVIDLIELGFRQVDSIDDIKNYQRFWI